MHQKIIVYIEKLRSKQDERQRELQRLKTIIHTFSFEKLVNEVNELYTILPLPTSLSVTDAFAQGAAVAMYDMALPKNFMALSETDLLTLEQTNQETVARSEIIKIFGKDTEEKWKHLFITTDADNLVFRANAETLIQNLPHNTPDEKNIKIQLLNILQQSNKVLATLIRTAQQWVTSNTITLDTLQESINTLFRRNIDKDLEQYNQEHGNIFTSTDIILLKAARENYLLGIKAQITKPLPRDFMQKTETELTTLSQSEPVYAMKIRQAQAWVKDGSTSLSITDLLHLETQPNVPANDPIHASFNTKISPYTRETGTITFNTDTISLEHISTAFTDQSDISQEIIKRSKGTKAKNKSATMPHDITSQTLCDVFNTMIADPKVYKMALRVNQQILDKITQEDLRLITEAEKNTSLRPLLCKKIFQIMYPKIFENRVNIFSVNDIRSIQSQRDQLMQGHPVLIQLNIISDIIHAHRGLPRNLLAQSKNKIIESITQALESINQSRKYNTPPLPPVSLSPSTLSYMADRIRIRALKADVPSIQSDDANHNTTTEAVRISNYSISTTLYGFNTSDDLVGGTQIKGHPHNGFLGHVYGLLHSFKTGDTTSDEKKLKGFFVDIANTPTPYHPYSSVQPNTIPTQAALEQDIKTYGTYAMDTVNNPDQIVLTEYSIPTSGISSPTIRFYKAMTNQQGDPVYAMTANGKAPLYHLVIYEFQQGSATIIPVKKTYYITPQSPKDFTNDVNTNRIGRQSNAVLAF